MIELDRFEKKVEIKITEQLVERYAVISGDVNSIHLIKSAANHAGFTNRVAHGMLSMAISASCISPLLQHGWLLSDYKMTFSSPLFIGDILRIEIGVVRLLDQKMVLKIHGEKDDGNKVMSGKIELEGIR